MGTVDSWTVLKAIELAEITRGGSKVREKMESRTKPWGTPICQGWDESGKEPNKRKTLSELGGNPGDCDAIKAKQRKSFKASLVAQWLRIRLPVQGTRVRSLVWEDPT